MNFYLGLAAVFLTLKSLGGSFEPLFDAVGLTRFHGPLTGTFLNLLMLAFFWSYRESQGFPYTVETPPSRRQRWIVEGLVLVVVVAALGMRVQRVLTDPISVQHADMLPLVLRGLEALEAGRNPYLGGFDVGNGNTYPAYYLPGLWLPYLPFHVLGWDIRWMNVLAHAVLYGVLWALFRRRRHYYHSYTATGLLLLVLIGLHGFSKKEIAFVADVHTAGFSTFLTLFFWCVSQRWWRAVGIVTALLILSRELAVLFTLPIAFYGLKYERKPFLRALAGTVGVGLLLTVPFIILSPAHFFSALVIYAGHYRATSLDTLLSWYSAAGFLRMAHLDFLQPFLQWTGVLVSAWWIARGRVKSLNEALAQSGVAFIPFILFVSSLWHYVFFEPVAWIGLLLMVDRGSARRS